MGILFSQVKLARPEQNRCWDVLIIGREIVAIAPQLQAEGHLVIPGNGRLLVPGFVDLHCHLREPGFENKETIASGTRAAAKGGFTTVCAMPNTAPPPDTPERLHAIAERIAKSAVIPVKLVAAATIGRAGREATDAGALKAAGAVALSDDGSGIQDRTVLSAVLSRCAAAGLPYFSHCEDESLSAGGIFHDSWPIAAETTALARELSVVKETGAAYHLCHTSSGESVSLLEEAKSLGLAVTAEVTPHHLVLATEDIPDWTGLYKVNPPLRPRAEVEALIAGLNREIIDCIATDHAPHTAAEKALPADEAPFGFSGLEVAFAALYTKLVKKGRLRMERLLSALCREPRRVLGQYCPEFGLKPGDPADLTLLDLDKTQVVTAESLVSQGKNTPFIGHILTGWPQLTMVNGEIIWSDKEFGR